MIKRKKKHQILKKQHKKKTKKTHLFSTFPLSVSSQQDYSPPESIFLIETSWIMLDKCHVPWLSPSCNENETYCQLHLADCFLPAAKDNLCSVNEDFSSWWKKKKKVQERTDVQHLQNRANIDTVLLSWKCVKYMKDLYVFTTLIIPDIIN